MPYRTSLFKNLLKYTILKQYPYLLVVALALTLLGFINTLNQAKKSEKLFEQTLALRLQQVNSEVVHLNLNYSNAGNDTQIRNAIHRLLLDYSDIDGIYIKSENETAHFSVDDERHLSIRYSDWYESISNNQIGNIFIKIDNSGKHPAIALANRIDPDANAWVGIKLKLMLDRDLKQSESDTHWVAINNPVSVLEFQKAIASLFKVNIGNLLLKAIVFLIVISLVIFVVMALQAKLRSIALANELNLVEKSIVENHDISESKVQLVSIVKPLIHQLRFRFQELKLQHHEVSDRLNQFYRASVDAIVIHHDGIPIFFNPAFPEMTGYPESALYRLRLFDVIKVDEDLLKEARDARQPSVEGLLRQSNGNTLYVEVQVKSIKFRGQVAESVVIRDITHRKFMERELQLQRMRQVKSVIDGQEKERQRLSRELHDGLGQNLVAIKLKLESIPHDMAGELNSTLTQVKQMFNHTIEEVRRISNNLMPAALKEFSLAVVLRNLCNEVENNSGISVGLTVGVLPEPIDQLLKTYVYRIIQEALTNVIKHSGASRANITVYADFSNLHLIIEDNGVGFNTAIPTDTGNGLYNMKERAILLNGSINIISSEGKGTKIVAQFPLKPQNQSVNG